MLQRFQLLLLFLFMSLAGLTLAAPVLADEESQPEAKSDPGAQVEKEIPVADDEESEPSKPQNPYLGQGSILTIKGKTLVLEADESTPVEKGTAFEIYVELPNNLGTAILGKGRVVSTDDGIFVGKIESKDETAKLSKEMKIRFLREKSAPKKRMAKKVVTPNVEPKLTPSNKTSEDFREIVGRYKKAVCLVKDANNKAHGTAFIISIKHRLLVTNAHVADIAQKIVLNESRTEYQVKKRWYHPDTIRTMYQDNQTAIKSTNSTHGKVDPAGTDLAVLQLEMIGPELPSEVILAGPEEAKTIVGAEIGMYGYPSYNTSAAAGQFAQATFVKGTISRLERLKGHDTDQKVVDRRRVVYAGPNYPGFSGSPIFLDNGRVVVINNAVMNLKDGTKVAYGMRVDALWDLLGEIKFADKIANAPEQLPEPVFTKGQNPNALKMINSLQLLATVQQNIKDGDYKSAFDNLSKAEEETPWYWAVYNDRAKTVDRYIKSMPNLGKEDLSKLYAASRSYFSKADELHNKSFNIRALPILLDFTRQSINLARYSESKDVLKEAIDILDNPDVVKVAFEGKNAAYFLALRATVKKDLGMLKSAIADIDEAIRRQPSHKSYQDERQRIQRLIQLGGNGTF